MAASALPKCRTCERYLPESSFRTIRREQYVNKCLDCRECESKRNGARNKARRDVGDPGIPLSAKKKRCKHYGLTVETYDAMIWLQDDKCAICGADSPHYIDHDHATGAVRGILCHGCNTGIGLLKEKIETLESAIRYLEMSNNVDVSI